MRKRILALFLVWSMIVSLAMPNVVFATEASENVVNVEENVEGESVDAEEAAEEVVEEESNKLLCVDCESENITSIAPALHMYHCEDCGKYFTVDAEKNNKSIDSQIKTVEDGLKNQINNGMFGEIISKDVVFHLYYYDAIDGEVLFDVEFVTRAFNKIPEINSFLEFYTGKIDESILEKLDAFTFKGWAKSEGIAKNGIITVEGGKAYPTPNSYKYWTVFEAKKGVVTVHNNGIDNDVILDSKEVSYPHSYTYDEIPSIDGRKFLGWSYDKNAEVPEFDTINLDVVTEDVDIYAIWKGKNKVRYEDGEPIEYEDGETVELKSEYADKTGYTLVGWTDDKNDTESKFPLGGTIENIDKSYVFYPVYEANDCTIVIDGAEEIKKYDEEITLPDEPNEGKDGHEFLGWTNEVGGEVVVEKGGKHKVQGDVTFYPVFVPLSFDVTIDDNTETKKYGDKVKLPTTCEVPDDTKVFDYYKDEKGNHYSLGDEVLVDGEKTITPVFKDKEKFKVKYFDGDVEYENLLEEVFEGHTAVGPATPPTKANYVFVKWNLDGNEYKFDKAVTKDIKLVAVWEGVPCDVTIDGNTETKKYGDIVKLPETCEVPDDTKVFDYYKDEKGNHYALGDEVLVDGKKTITPVFKDKEKFKVKYFDGDVEYENLLEEVFEGHTAVGPATPPTKANYVFVKWNLDGNEYKFDKPVTEDIKLVAVWEGAPCDVTIDGNTETKKYGDKVKLPTTYTPQNNTMLFDCYQDEDGNKYALGDEVLVDGNKTINPVLKKKNWYTVKFYDGTKEYKVMTVYEGDKVTAPSPAPEKEGHSFGGWYEDNGFKTAFNFTTKKITGNTSIYAKFNPNKYKLKIGDKISEDVEYGKEYTLPSTYEINEVNKKLAGFKDQDGKTYLPGEKFKMPAKAMTFTVNITDKIKYVVTFYRYDTKASKITETSVYEGDKVAAPSISGGTNLFKGWYTDTTFKTEFNFTKAITNNTSVYAKLDTGVVFEQKFDSKGKPYYELTNPRKVTFLVDGAVYKEITNHPSGNKVEPPKEVPSKTGYTFENWYADSAFKTKFDFTKTINADTKIYGKLNKNKYKVTFVTSGASFSNQSVTVSYGDKVKRPADPENIGYIFIDWYADKNLKTLFNFNNGIIEDTNIYPKFEKREYTVRFESTYTFITSQWNVTPEEDPGHLIKGAEWTTKIGYGAGNIKDFSVVSQRTWNGYNSFCSDTTFTLTPQLENHKFLGWYTKDGKKFTVPFKPEDVNNLGQYVYYAKWERLPYVKEIVASASRNHEEALQQLINNGYCPMNVDFNGDYSTVLLGLKFTDNGTEAIKGIKSYWRKSNKGPKDITGYDTVKRVGTNTPMDMNYDGGGRYVYLYTSKIDGPYPIIDVISLKTKSYEGYNTVLSVEDNNKPANMNQGTGGGEKYIHYKVYIEPYIR